MVSPYPGEISGLSRFEFGRGRGKEELCDGEKGGGKGKGTYDLKGVVDDTDGHEFLAVVAAVHHQGVGQALDDGALGFAEALHGVAAGRVGDVYWGADLDVISVVYHD